MGNAIFVTEELMKFTSRQVITVTRRITANLRDRTPKKSGYAASNWIPSLGDERGTFGSKSNVSYAAMSAGLAEISNYRITRTLPPVIRNDVPYIDLLNEGSSLQAPAGFIQEAIFDAIAATAGVRGS